jgi:hypothetical protein
LLVTQFAVILLGFIDGISPAENGCEMFIHVKIMQAVEPQFVVLMSQSHTTNKKEKYYDLILETEASQ